MDEDTQPPSTPTTQYKRLKPIPPDVVTAASTPSPKAGKWIPRRLHLLPTEEKKSPAPPATSPTPSPTVKSKHEDLTDDPLIEDEALVVNITPLKNTINLERPILKESLIICDYCKKEVIKLTPKCTYCNRAYCISCQEDNPLTCIVDTVVDQETGKGRLKCFGCMNGVQPKTTKRKKPVSDDEILIEEMDRKAKEIDEELVDFEPFKKPTPKPPSQPAASSRATTIIRILPDPQGPDLVYTPIDRALCELPVCYKCVEKGVSVRSIKTATGVSMLCGHAVYCVECTTDCLGQKGVRCPYPGCEHLLDTIILIQNTVLKTQT